MEYTIETLAHRIREWEYDAGESFTDYFLDAYSYHQDRGWLLFLKNKGFDELLAEIENSRYRLKDGTLLSCTDQQLKFEPNASLMEKWDDDLYFKDVLLWAEFMLQNDSVMQEFQDFLEDS